MSYRIAVQYENGIFISYFGPEILRGEEFDQYLGDIVDLNVIFDRAGFTKIYHILVLESSQFDFETMLKALTTIRQNRHMSALRNHMQSLSMMVTSSPVMAQFIDTMLSNTNYGTRLMSTFTTLEAALAFIRFEKSLPPDAPPPTEASSSPNQGISPDL